MIPKPLLHPVELANALHNIDLGDIWVAGQQAGDTRLQLGGPIYFWLMMPARLFSDPVLGLFLWHFVLESLAIGLWVVLGLRNRVRPAVVCGVALLLALYNERKADPKTPANYCRDQFAVGNRAVQAFENFEFGGDCRI